MVHVAVDIWPSSGNGCTITLLMSTLPESGGRNEGGRRRGKGDRGRKRVILSKLLN